MAKKWQNEKGKKKVRESCKGKKTHEGRRGSGRLRDKSEEEEAMN